MKNIIKNSINFNGDDKTIEEVLNYIKSERSACDFNKIKPIEKDINDIIFDDYINLCLNIYLQQVEDKSTKEKLVNMFKFVGITREVPYEFHELTDEEIKDAKTNYSPESIARDTVTFLSKVKDKSIFNGWMIRDAVWGTGTEAINSRINGNKLVFISYNSIPIEIFKQLSIKYPNLEIKYTYNINDNLTILTIRRGKETYVQDSNSKYDKPLPYELISQNVCI